VWGAQKKRARVIVSAMALLIVPWYVFLTLLEGNQEAIAVTTVLPLMTAVGVLATMIESRRGGRST
jgi:hypothetical protein